MLLSMEFWISIIFAGSISHRVNFHTWIDWYYSIVDLIDIITSLSINWTISQQLNTTDQYIRNEEQKKKSLGT